MPHAPISAFLASRASLAAIAAVGLAGCGQMLKEEQLENVARDWCLTIRASQVIPVYPLTEDLVPGDVFIVNTPLDTQASIYKKDGFLPLDQLVTRLPGLDYETFYAPAYWSDDYARVPHERPLPEDAAPASKVEAPRAAFPSYQFAVQSGVGAKLAIPVSGVPLGLGFMQADSATGSITISDAYTYGVDGQQLIAKLDDWATQANVRNKLAEVAAATPDQLYLRVVNRVYLTGAVVISMNNADQFSAGGDVGAAKTIDLPTVKDRETATNYAEATSELSTALNDAMPGGSIRVAQASSRSVTLAETFDRPLVIGYLGFDIPVRRNGDLGPPVATQDRLRETIPDTERTTVQTLTEAEKEFHFRLLKLKAADAESQLYVIETAAGSLPGDGFPQIAERAKGPGANSTDVLAEFIETSIKYVGDDSGTGERPMRLVRLIDGAFDDMEREDDDG